MINRHLELVGHDGAGAPVWQHVAVRLACRGDQVASKLHLSRVRVAGFVDGLQARDLRLGAAADSQLVVKYWSHGGRLQVKLQSNAF